MIEAINHAKKQHPKESCGLVIGDKYIPCENISKDPQKSFKIDNSELIPCDAIVHSHPCKYPFLSISDRVGQNKTQCDWWIIINNKIKKFRFVPFLRGRQFEYGKMDCYTLIKDAFSLCGINLINYKRKGEIQEIEGNAFVKNLPKTGFYQVDDLEIGDVILTSLNGTANHASIYLGNEEVIHHPYGGLSRRELMGGIWHKNIHSFWRHKKFKQGMIEAITNDLRASDNG